MRRLFLYIDTDTSVTRIKLKFHSSNTYKSLAELHFTAEAHNTAQKTVYEIM